MDFVASRTDERKYGWRARIGRWLERQGVTVFDPWDKPRVRNLHEYGREDDKSADEIRKKWSFSPTRRGAQSRGDCASLFWETYHIDLRMVDVSDFVIAYCPTSVYSVGTVHEIVLARQELKPVLLVSPAVVPPSLEALREHLADDRDGRKLLQRLEAEVPIRENGKGIPSPWYMRLVGSESIFDSFGFQLPEFEKSFSHPPKGELDRNEARDDLERPLLPLLKGLTEGRPPQRWNHMRQRLERDDDWLLLDASLHGRR